MGCPKVFFVCRNSRIQFDIFKIFKQNIFIMRLIRKVERGLIGCVSWLLSKKVKKAQFFMNYNVNKLAFLTNSVFRTA